MDPKSLPAVAKNLGKRLSLPSDRCSEQLLTALAKAHGGVEVLDLLISLSQCDSAILQNANQSAKYASSATYKINIPARLPTTDVMKQKVQEDILVLAFLDASRQIVRTDYELAEIGFKKKVLQKIKSATMVKDHFLSDVTRCILKELGKTETDICRSTEDLLNKSEWISWHSRKLSEDDEYQATSLDNADDSSLRDFISHSFEICERESRNKFVSGMQIQLGEENRSAQECVQGIVDRCRQLQRSTDDLRQTANSHDKSINDLRDRVLKESDQIVKLSKLNFRIRLDNTSQEIKKGAARTSYERSLTHLKEAEQRRKQEEIPPSVDPVTGFEIPFCPWSEVELYTKLKSLFDQLQMEHGQLEGVIRAIHDLTDKVVGDVVAVRIPGVISTYTDRVNEISVNLDTFFRKLAEFGPKTRFSSNLMNLKLLQESLKSKEEFLAKFVSPTITVPAGLDLAEVGSLVDGKIFAVVQEQDEASDSIRQLNSVIDQALDMRRVCLTSHPLQPFSDSFFTPPNSDDNIIRDPHTEPGSGPSMSFYTSTPYEHVDVQRNRKLMFGHVGKIQFDQPA